MSSLSIPTQLKIFTLIIVFGGCTQAWAGGTLTACEEPNVLIILDNSGSMNENGKWNQAKEAIVGISTGFDSLMRLGLMVFPFPNAVCRGGFFGRRCDGGCDVQRPGAVLAECAPMNGNNINTALNFIPNPPDGNLTPLGSGLREGRNYISEQTAPGRRSFIILVTDGIERCGGDAANQASRAFEDETKVFVIGFGRGVDAGALNRIASNGGTGNYVSVDNGQQLFESLEAIATEVSQEICDGLDNDCDGLLDEGVEDLPCDTDCGPGVQRCLDGTYSECFGTDIPDEECNGLDDDCDGLIDELVRNPCTTLTGNPGYQICNGTDFDEDCFPNDPEREEVCDGVDNDEDGRVDEGTEEECQVDCNSGRRLCIEGALLACNALPQSDEVCNGLDDDCDGEIDESQPCAGEEICDPDGICLRRCMSNECPPDYFCDVDGYCHPLPCEPECGADEVCRDQTCYQRCVLEQDCPNGFECNNRFCTPVANSSSPQPNQSPNSSPGFNEPLGGSADTSATETGTGLDPSRLNSMEEEVEEDTSESETGCACKLGGSNSKISWLWILALLLARPQRRQ